MHYTRGVTTIISILIAILVALIAAGVAYVIGVNSNTMPVGDTVQYDSISNQQQTQPTRNDQSGRSPSTSSGQQSGLCAGVSQPKLIIKNPSNGQSYQQSDSISVTWESCNIPSHHSMYIGLIPEGQFQGSPPVTPLASATNNDGNESFPLSQLSVSGGSYRIFMQDNDLPKGTTNTWSEPFTITKSSNTQQWSLLSPNQTGFGRMIYPSDWFVEQISGGSYGTQNDTVGVRLSPSTNSTHSITIGGWQYGCDDVQLGGNTQLTKAYCIQSVGSGGLWSGTYITTGNQGSSMQGTPMVTRSNDPQLSSMFDSIVSKNSTVKQ